MLRVVLQHNSEAARELYAELAPILAPDCEGQGSQARCATLIDGLDQMVVASGLKPRLRDHSIPESDIPMLAKEAMKQTRLLVNNPRPSRKGTRSDFEAAW
jgi:alcohol dehydrogenase class IV